MHKFHSLFRTHFSTTSTTTLLPNGLTVASSNTPGYFPSLAILIKAGTRYETSSTKKGCAQMLSRLAFKSTQHYPSNTLPSLIESLGLISSKPTREHILYHGNITHSNLSTLMHIYSQTIRYPQLLQSELESQRKAAVFELQEIEQRPIVYLRELLLGRAYGNETLGNSLYQPKHVWESDGITLNDLLEYRQCYYRPDTIIIAASGVEHSKLLELSVQYFDMEPSSVALAPLIPCNYTGGSVYVNKPVLPLGYQHLNLPPQTHALIAFPSFPSNHPLSYVMATLQMLLGGGSAFSAGGPGKGMYSRLYTDVLCQYWWIEECQSFHYMFSDSGLFGIHAGCGDGRYLSRMLNVMFGQIVGLLGGDVGDVELLRAKNRLKASVMMNLESRGVEVEEVGVGVGVGGWEGVLEKIDGIGREDVARVARMVFCGEGGGVGGSGGKGKMTVVVQGDLHDLPDVDALARRYGLLKVD